MRQAWATWEHETVADNSGRYCRRYPAAIYIGMCFLANSRSRAAPEVNKDAAAAEAAVPTVNLGTSFDVGGLTVSEMKAQLTTMAGTKPKGVWC